MDAEPTTVEWTGSHDGSPVHFGYRADRLVAQVAYYDVVGGAGPGWVGYIHGHRVTGRCTDAATAQAKTEMAVMDRRVPD